MSYAIVKMGYKMSDVDDFCELPSNKKAFVMGSIIKHLEDKKKADDEAKRKVKPVRRR